MQIGSGYNRLLHVKRCTCVIVSFVSSERSGYRKAIKIQNLFNGYKNTSRICQFTANQKGESAFVNI